MVLVRFRTEAGGIIPCLSPLATVDTITVTKEGVLFLKKTGEVLFFYPTEKLAEVIEGDNIYMCIKEEKDGLTFYKWIHCPRFVKGEEKRNKSKL